MPTIMMVNCHVLGAPKRNKGYLGFLEKTTAIVMAGGDNRRMGIDKAMLPINGLPIIEKICEQLCQLEYKGRI